VNLPPQARAVVRALGQIDASQPAAFIPISTTARDYIEEVLRSTKNDSDKVALLYFLAYKDEVPGWDLKRVPPGWRPHDKRLAAGLTERQLTLHGNITSPGENMGIKGNAAGFDLFARPRLGEALRYFQSHPSEVRAGLAYIAQRFKDSYRERVAIAGPGPDELVYTEALRLAHKLIFADSGGHFPQFLVAGLLKALHEQHGTGLLVRTYHPNASDKSGGAAGDVEIATPDGEAVLEGYEVTVRPDWKNRRPDLLKKMQRFGLGQYNVICLLEGEDATLADPDRLHEYMTGLGQDIAVVDIRCFTAIVLQLLDREHRKRVFLLVEKYVRDPKLCGVPEYIERLGTILEGM
jgi:hypothetical protein